MDTFVTLLVRAQEELDNDFENGVVSKETHRNGIGQIQRLLDNYVAEVYGESILIAVS
jgi:hypothetical protein